MNYKMLVTTFRDDIKQFHMFCYCLEKNWQGKKDLIVCLGANDNLMDFKKITDEIFDSTWNIEIKPTIYSYNRGTTEQQVNTVYYSVHSGADDIIVWDCKDFLLRPCSHDIFVKSGKYRWTFIIPDQKIVDTHYDYSGLVDVPIDHLEFIDNLRPWIWNVNQLTKYWNTLNERFGHFSTWQEDYPGGNEIHGYYIYTLTDPDRTIDFLKRDDTPLLLGGGWTHQTYNGILQEVQDFDRWSERIVWKHSRKLEDPRCLDVTQSVLLKYGIEKEIIDRVFCYEEPGKP
jgi:hypothetical protein